MSANLKQTWFFRGIRNSDRKSVVSTLLAKGDRYSSVFPMVRKSAARNTLRTGF